MLHPFKKCSFTVDNGAWKPGAWYTGPPCKELLRDALALAHGLALDLDGIGVVDDPVTDGVCRNRGIYNSYEILFVFSKKPTSSAHDPIRMSMSNPERL